MDHNANDLLLRALRYTTPCIITNSKTGWVDYTCKKYMPETWKTLKKEKIKVISAREQFQNLHQKMTMNGRN